MCQTSVFVYSPNYLKFNYCTHYLATRFFKRVLKSLFLCFESFPPLCISCFSCSLCLHLSASHSSRSVGDKDPIRRYWNKWPPALLSTGSTQLNLMLGCPCVFFLTLANKLIYSNLVMSLFASESSNIHSTLLWGCA